MNHNKVIKLWLFPKNRNNECRSITKDEQNIADKLPLLKAKEFVYSRGCVREALSDVFGMHSLKIPLKAFPGKTPILPRGFGYVSFSHCKDNLLVGWSFKKIGVDIERFDRIFDANAISNFFYFKKEKDQLSLSPRGKYRLETLKLWVSKEASIKWQQNGSISKDLLNWEISQNNQKAFHKLINKKINIFNLKYKSWYLALAYNCRKIMIKKIIEKN